MKYLHKLEALGAYTGGISLGKLLSDPTFERKLTGG